MSLSPCRSEGPDYICNCCGDTIAEGLHIDHETRDGKVTYVRAVAKAAGEAYVDDNGDLAHHDEVRHECGVKTSG